MRFKRLHPVALFVMVAGGYSVDAAEYSCIPVRASGVEGVDWYAGPTANEITLVRGGQSVEIHVLISGFGTLAVTGYQARLDCQSLQSNMQGEAVEIQTDCLLGGGDWDVDFCMGINELEPGFVLAPALTVLACSPHLCNQNSGLACGAVAIQGDSGFDNGGLYYAMTFAVDVSADMKGTIAFTLSSDGNETFIKSAKGKDTPIDAINPALITVPVRACCGVESGNLGCVDVTQDECDNLDGAFSALQICSDVDVDGDGVDLSCDVCPGIDDKAHAPACIAAVPAISGWGLIVLSLCLMIGVKTTATR